MTRIGIISAPHGYWDDKFLTYFEECDEIWHAGDICSSETMERLQAPFGNPARRHIVRAVCGRSATKETLGIRPRTAMAATYVACFPRCCASSAKKAMYIYYN